MCVYPPKNYIFQIHFFFLHFPFPSGNPANVSVVHSKVSQGFNREESKKKGDL